MYYPEANVLVPATVDASSKTPAFKSVLITIEREDALPNGTVTEQKSERVPLELVRK
jgi:hypothetical protein